MKELMIDLLPPILLREYRKARRSMHGVSTPRREFLLPEINLDSLAERLGCVELPVSMAQDRGPLGLPTHEAFVLGALCRKLRPKTLFEFGTYTGLSSLVLAANSEESARMYTLDVDPAQANTHEHGLGVGMITAFPLGKLFRESPYAHKVTQLLGDSQKMDFAAYEKKIDFVFVDADHSYRFVRKDTDNALRMRSPSGIIIWDDYVWSEDHPECAGVARALHEELRKGEKNLFRIKGTRLAALFPNRPL